MISVVCSNAHRVFKSDLAAWRAAPLVEISVMSDFLAEVRKCPVCGSGIANSVSFLEVLRSVVKSSRHMDAGSMERSITVLIHYATRRLAELSDPFLISEKPEPAPSISNFGQVVRERRIAAGYTRKSLSQLTRLCSKTIQNVEHSTHLPSERTIERLKAAGIFSESEAALFKKLRNQPN